MDLFGNSSNYQGKTTYAGDRVIYSCYTRGYRALIVSDFKIRRALPHRSYVPVRLKYLYDEKGEPLDWVLRDSKYYTYDENNKKKTRVREPHSRQAQASVQVPRYNFYPTDNLPTERTREVIQGYMGDSWVIGTRGNSMGILKIEVANHPILTGVEKVGLMAWLSNPIQLSNKEHMTVDGWFCRNIRESPKWVSKEMILNSGLDERTVDNLIHNLENYQRRDRD